jgi:hypothetical protein
MQERNYMHTCNIAVGAPSVVLSVLVWAQLPKLVESTDYQIAEILASTMPSYDTRILLRSLEASKICLKELFRL